MSTSLKDSVREHSTCCFAFHTVASGLKRRHFCSGRESKRATETERQREREKKEKEGEQGGVDRGRRDRQTRQEVKKWG